MDNEQDAKTDSPKITIDGVEYLVDSLSDRAKQLIGTLRMADRELAQVDGRLSLLRIARQALAQNLQVELAAGKVGDEKI